MTDQPIRTSEYRNWLTDIKQRIRQAQVKAAVQVNTALLTFNWELGAEIVERQKSSQWGSGFLKQLSADLMAEFPDMKGFSFNNLQYIKRCFFIQEVFQIWPQLVTKLISSRVFQNQQKSRTGKMWHKLCHNWMTVLFSSKL
jgi:predicted nuclease of restriction endonuclease-like (RecB) superfamily